jgi:predicted phage tail protein
VESLCQGMLPCATVTFASEVADVGLRPGEVILLAENKQSDQSLEGRITKIEACETESARHDGEENLGIN